MTSSQTLETLIWLGGWIACIAILTAWALCELRRPPDDERMALKLKLAEARRERDEARIRLERLKQAVRLPRRRASE